MKNILYFSLLLTLFIMTSCKEPELKIDIHEENWAIRKADNHNLDSLIFGKSYLSVYSQMYSFSQNRKFNLTGIVSMRNVSESDTIYLLQADYYNTEGHKIRTYFDFPIYLRPMETVEIIIAKDDIEGGTGSNFLLQWKIPKDCPEPLFEGLMNLIEGAQGASFTTHSIRIE